MQTLTQGMFGPENGDALTGFQPSVGLAQQERVDEAIAEALEGGARPGCPLGPVPVATSV